MRQNRTLQPDIEMVIYDRVSSVGKFYVTLSD